MAFIDYENAFDSISHAATFRAMNNQDMDEVYVNIIKDACTNSLAQIQTDVLSRKINISKGVRQSDPLSLNLFTAALQEILRELILKEKALEIKEKV